jgi:hypothetical protein
MITASLSGGGAEDPDGCSHTSKKDSRRLADGAADWLE